MKKYITSFYAYFKSVCYAPVVRIPVLSSFFVTYFILGITVFGGVISQDGWAMLIMFACAFVFLAAIIMNNYFKRKPDLASLMPISPTQSVVYRFLSVFVMFIIMMVIMAAVMLVVGGIVFLFSMIPGCSEAMEEDPSDIIYAVSNPIGVYGGLFGFIYFVIMYSAGMIAGLIQSRKNRNIYYVCLCAGLLLAEIFMNLPLYLNPEYGAGTQFVLMSPVSGICYEAMALPQLCIALWAVVAAAMLGWAIYLGIKENKLKSSY